MKKIPLIILALLIAVPAWGASTSYRRVEPETANYYSLAGASGAQFTLNEYIKSIKYVSGVVLSSVTLNVSNATGYVFVTNASSDLRWAKGFYVTLTDTGGKTFKALAGAYGTGETLSGSELLSNPSFDVNTDGWTSSLSTLASIAGGYVNNCLEVTPTGGSPCQTYAGISLTLNSLYKGTAWVKAAVSKPVLTKFGKIGVTDYAPISATSSGSWTQFNGNYHNAQYTTEAFFVVYTNDSADKMLFDEASVQQVTAPSATGFTISGTPTVDSGFNYNSASYTVTLTRN